MNFTNRERIVHVLMLKSFFMPDISLFKGQMGIALAISNLCKNTSSKILYDFLYDLVEILTEKVNKGLPFSLGNGLAGIGWGIEYLIQNGFVEGEGIEVCEEIDNKIMEADIRRITDLSLETGFEGLLHYIIFHLQGSIKQNNNIPFDDTYLFDIYTKCKKLEDNNVDDSLKKLLNSYISFAENKMLLEYESTLSNFISVIPELDYEELASYPLGLNNGLAGVLVTNL